jgi:TPR repeat protein
LRRDAQQQLESQAANRCDELAGNPTDPKRSGNGVSSDVLKAQAKDAIVSCELAVQQSPNELRFQYQLARALRFVDPNKAFEIQKKLVGLHYPAACDNFGWLLYMLRKDIPGAVRYFRIGTQLGDPDSMVSLAEMIDQGFATPQSQGESKIELLERAAALGSSDASRRLEKEREDEVRSEQDIAHQQEQQRLMLQMLGTFIQNIRR